MWKLRHSALEQSLPEWVGASGGGGGAQSERAQSADVGGDGPGEQAGYEKLNLKSIQRSFFDLFGASYELDSDHIYN